MVFLCFLLLRLSQGAGRDAFEAVYESEDPLGNHGVRLSKEIVKVAGRAMEKNFTSLGPYVLPISEQYKVVKALALRKVCLWVSYHTVGLLLLFGGLAMDDVRVFVDCVVCSVNSYMEISSLPPI